MNNLWIWLALVSAFTGGTNDALTKKALKNHDLFAVAWLRQMFVVLLLLPCLFFISVPPLNEKFYKAFFIALPFEVFAYIFYMKAIKSSPLSLTVPFLSITPISLMFMPYLILGESVSVQGGVGILLIAFGCYTLNLKEINQGLLEPIKAIKNERGSVFMIVTAILYSVTNTFGKQAIENSSALFFGVTYNIAFFIAITPVVFSVGKIHSSGRICKKAFFASLAPGFCGSITVIFYTLAMSLANVAYMVAVSRLSLLVGVMYGHFLFKESGFRERLLGTILMLTGFSVIALRQQ